MLLIVVVYGNNKHKCQIRQTKLSYLALLKIYFLQPFVFIDIFVLAHTMQVHEAREVNKDNNCPQFTPGEIRLCATLTL
jgi:hypothetical protein